tara:strand:+ start:122 stop:2554 length:2433 start_codon:yes stop_codon:yes gene_type:complete
MRKGATTRRETSRDDDDDDDILRRFDGRFSPALGLFEALEKDPAEKKKKKKKKKEKGCDIIVASIKTSIIEHPTSGVTCEVVVDERSGEVKAGIERDDDGDFMYQGTYDENGLRSGEKCVQMCVGDSVLFGRFAQGKPNGWCVYVYPKIANVRNALLSKDDGRVRESGMKRLIKECDYIVGYFTNGYVEPRYQERLWYRNARDDRTKMTLDEEMEAILLCLDWKKEAYGFDDEKMYEKLHWTTTDEIRNGTESKRGKPAILPFDVNSCAFRGVCTNEITDESKMTFVSINGCKTGELVAIFSSYPPVVKRLKGSSRRWDYRDKIVALDDLPSDEEDPGDENFCHQDEGEDIGSEKRGRGGLFLEYGHDSDTHGTYAAVHVKEEYNCERVPLYHWKMVGTDYCLCLRALRDIKANECISVGPDYTGGWRLNPHSEAGYYHHLMNTQEKIIFESTTTKNKKKKARRVKNVDGDVEKEQENVSNVRIKRHGPWLCAYIDKVEQGLMYDSNWKEGDEEEDEEDGKENDNNARKCAHIDRSVVGFEYIRAMATIAIAFGCASNASWLMPILYPKRFDDDVKKIRILNLGFGTGALSGFLCSKLNTKYEEKIDIESVEYSESMCDAILRNSGTLEFPRFPNEIIHECSAERYLEDELERLCKANSFQSGFSCVFLDCYDGQGNIPKRCLEKSFVQNIYDSLEKSRGGVLVCNCWSGNLKALAEFRATLASVFSLDHESDARETNWIETVRAYKEPNGQTNNCIVIALRVEKGVGVADPYLPTADPSECLRRAGFDCTRDFSFSNLDALEELLLFEY